jgi:hypothetical protein
MPLYPQNAPVREHVPILYPFVVFTFRLTIKSTKEFGGASIKTKK